MGIINWVAFGGILIDLIIVSILISSSYWGYRRGLVAVLFKVLLFIVSLLIVFLLYKPVSNSIIDNSQLDEWLSTAIRDSLDGTAVKDGTLLEASESNISTAVVDLINSFITEALKKSSVDPLGYVSINLAYFMIRVGTMLGLLIISRFLLIFVRFVAELIGNLPIIKMFNKSGGLIYGILKGFLTIYVILAVISVISPLINNIILNLIIK